MEMSLPFYHLELELETATGEVAHEVLRNLGLGRVPVEVFTESAGRNPLYHIVLR